MHQLELGRPPAPMCQSYQWEYLWEGTRTSAEGGWGLRWEDGARPQTCWWGQAEGWERGPWGIWDGVGRGLGFLWHMGMSLWHLTAVRLGKGCDAWRCDAQPSPAPPSSLAQPRGAPRETGSPTAPQCPQLGKEVAHWVRQRRWCLRVGDGEECEDPNTGASGGGP